MERGAKCVRAYLAGTVVADTPGAIRHRFRRARRSGLIAFYNAKVDTRVDGKLQVRPSTKFA